MKAIKQLTTLFFAMCIVLAAGCAATTQGGTGQYLDDSVLTSKVKARIVEDPILKDGTSITVTTYQGVVQLSGFVSSADSIGRATEVASRVEGVKSVKNDIRLKDKPAQG